MGQRSWRPKSNSWQIALIFTWEAMAIYFGRDSKPSAWRRENAAGLPSGWLGVAPTLG